MQNIKVAVKILGGFIIVVLLAAIVGGIGIYSSMSLSDDGAVLNERATIAINAARLNRNLMEQRAYARGVALYVALSDKDSAKENETLMLSMSDEYETLSQKIKELAKNDKVASDMYEDIEAARAVYRDARTKFLADVWAAADLQSDMEGAIHKALADFAPNFDQLRIPVSNLVTFMDEQTDKQADTMAELSNTVLLILIVVLVFAVAAALVIGIYISRAISKPLTSLTGWLSQMGRGDMNFSPEETNRAAKMAIAKDEVGQSIKSAVDLINALHGYERNILAFADNNFSETVESLGAQDTIGNALIKLSDSLNEAFGEINSATNQVASGAKQIADGAQSLAQGSTQQAAAVEQLSSSISEVAQKTKENADQANRAATLADDVRSKAETGSNQMNDMINAVKEINDASQSIQKVIKVIDDIAFQTNILALNAAVEAARAGQHGKGFAVVAEEVRSLAAKSSAAAADTGTLIANSMEKAELGAKIAEETSDSLTQIVAGINRTTEIVGEIASSSEQQSAAISQINNGIDQVAQVVQQNSATSEESAATAEELSGQSSTLEELVAEFKLKGSDNRRNRLAVSPRASGGAKKSLSLPPKSASSVSSSDFGKY